MTEKNTPQTEDQANPQGNPKAHATTEKTAATEATAPAGTTAPAALFDMAPKPAAPAKAATATATGGSGARPSAGANPQKPKAEPKKYPAGYELRYGREKFELPREMTAEEALAWLAEDDYPELKYQAENKVVHDADKKRLVVTREAQKKGAARGPSA